VRMTTQTNLVESRTAGFAADVRSGLCREGQKELPSKYLYDTVGSALFEAISVLPEYGLTRADQRLIERCAPEIARRLPNRVIVAELGSGSGIKTRTLLEALCPDRRITYFPIEISSTALSMIKRELSDLSGVKIVGLEREYLAGLAEVAARRSEVERLLVLFLGSTIGNFGAGADVSFLLEVRRRLQPGDVLLLGADLVKPRELFIAAYDDPTGVTAAFNRNLLARINRELDADFDLHAFEHEARFNERTSSVEMHLKSVKRQTVRVRAAGVEVTLASGETIWTESSRKYSLAELDRLATDAGFRTDAQWIDAEWAFAETLLLAV
jgi:L-histidine N-alpha-methyltransferase